MRNRYRIEIYDDIKTNDVTMYSDQGVDKDLLTEYVFSNVTKFSSTVHAYVFDTQKKKKTTAMFLPMETVQKIKAKLTPVPSQTGLGPPNMCGVIHSVTGACG